MANAQRWTEDDRRQVAVWLLAGKSMGRIARLLGVTRCVVIGRVSRDGALHAFLGQVLADKKIARDNAAILRPQPVKAKQSTVSKVEVKIMQPIRTVLPRGDTSSARGCAIGFECVEERPSPVAMPPKPGVPVSGVGVPLLDLARDGCRWPVGTGEVVGRHLFCGRRRAGEHTYYCAGHWHVAHPAATPRPAAMRGQGRH